MKIISVSKSVTFLLFPMLFLSALNIFAQTSNYTGEWQIDLKRSKLPEMMKMDSWTMKIEQMEKELIVNGTIKNSRGENTTTTTYDLSGKEITRDTERGAVRLKALFDKDNKLNITASRTMNLQTGETTVTNKEKWEIIDAGNTLKIMRQMETPNGLVTAEIYFTKIHQ